MNNCIPASAYCTKIFDGTHDTPKPVLSGFPLITSKNILGGILNLKDSYNISEVNYNDIQKRSKVSQWDILFSMIGSVGEIYLEKSPTIPYAIKNVGVFSCDDEYKAKWLYYYLKSPQAKQYIQNYLNGAVQKFLPLGTLRSFPVLPYDDKYIPCIDLLFALDSKIELNNRINAELEAMAKTIYDYWFVQFDFPDKNGKPYKSSGGIMVWNDELKREIPESWEVDKISKKVTIGSGYPFDSDEYNRVGEYKVITIKNVQDGFLDTTSVDYVSFLPNKISEFCILKVGDILMSLTGNVGRMCFVDQNNLLLNQRVGKLIGEKYFVIYSYFFFKRPENQQRLSKIANGSSQSNLSPIEAVKDNFAIPPKEIMNQFMEIVNPMIVQMLTKNKENHKLTELRDWLLPMLMNGQVKLK
jgi:type I restriction enzyme S subunit